MVRTQEPVQELVPGPAQELVRGPEREPVQELAQGQAAVQVRALAREPVEELARVPELVQGQELVQAPGLAAVQVQVQVQVPAAAPPLARCCRRRRTRPAWTAMLLQKSCWPIVRDEPAGPRNRALRHANVNALS